MHCALEVYNARVHFDSLFAYSVHCKESDKCVLHVQCTLQLHLSLHCVYNDIMYTVTAHNTGGTSW